MLVWQVLRTRAVAVAVLAHRQLVVLAAKVS
jgi:hypothetical protein